MNAEQEFDLVNELVKVFSRPESQSGVVCATSKADTPCGMLEARFPEVPPDLIKKAFNTLSQAGDICKIAPGVWALVWKVQGTDPVE